MNFKYFENSYKINFKLVFMIGILLFLIQPFAAIAEEEGYWILTDILGSEYEDLRSECYYEEWQYSKGSISYRWRAFKGVCNNDTEETFSATATWDSPPSKLIPGETIPLKAKVIREANTQGFFVNLGISIDKERPDLGCGGVSSSLQRIGRAEVHSKNNPATAQIDATFKVPTGSEGETFALRFCAMKGGWRYIYKWTTDQKIESQYQRPEVTENKAKPYVIAPGFQEGVQGKVFGVLHKVFIDGNEIFDFERTPLYIGSQAKTGPGVEIVLREVSGAVTRILENTTYEAREHIWKRDSQQVVWGRVIKGICEFYYPKGWRGYEKFGVETKRTSINWRGTTFTVSHIDDITTVEVQEGVVEVTNIETGTVSMVHAGERISIGDSDGEADSQVSTPATSDRTQFETVTTLSGTWMVVFTPGVRTTMTLQQSGDNITGTLKTTDGSRNQVVGNLVGRTLTLNRDTGLETVQHYQVTVERDRFTGTFWNEGKYPGKGTFTGTRSPSLDDTGTWPVSLNVTGTWTAYIPAKNWSHSGYQIIQNGQDLIYVVYSGERHTGRVLSEGTISYVEANVTGKVSRDGKRIDWSNGSYWTKDSE